MRFGGPSKEDKIAMQIRKSEQLIEKQKAAQDKLKQQLELQKLKDDEQLRIQKDRERIQREVHAQLEVQANEYIHQQLALQQAQMRSEFEQQLQSERLRGNIEMDGIQEASQNLESSFDKVSQFSTMSAHQVRMRNQKLGKEMRANMITTNSDF
jgi:hypothetical protein